MDMDMDMDMDMHKMLLYFFNVRQMMHNLVRWLQSRYTETYILSFREIIMLY